MQLTFQDCLPMIIITVAFVIITWILIRTAKNLARRIVSLLICWLVWLGGNGALTAQLQNVQQAVVAATAVASTGAVKYSDLCKIERFKENEDRSDIPVSVKSSDRVKVVVLQHDTLRSKVACALGLEKIAKLDIVK